jgi:hypothetical protein
MNNNILTLLFVTYGIAMIVLAAVINKEMNQENVSDRFVLLQQSILSLGSMSLAFGLLLAVLVNRNMLHDVSGKSVSLNKISLGLGALLTVSLLTCLSIMANETRSEELKDSKLRKAVVSGVVLAVLALLIHLPGFYSLISSLFKKRDSSIMPM